MAEFQSSAPSPVDDEHRRLRELFERSGPRLIFEEAPFAIILKDRHNRMVRANRFIEKLGGQMPDVAEGCALEDLFPADVAARFFAQDQEVLRTGEPLCNLIQHYHTVRGEHRWTLCDKIPLRDDGGAVAGLLVFERDISEQKRGELLENALFRISEATNNCTDLDDLYATIHGIVAELVPAKNCYIALCDPDQTTVRFAYFVDEKDALTEEERTGIPLRPMGLTHAVLQAGRAVLFDREQCLDFMRRGSLWGSIPWEWLGTPLRTTGGRIIGILVVQTYTPDVHYPPQAAELLTFVATQVANAMERHQSAAALASHREELARNVLELRRTWEQTLEVLSRTSEAHDIYTAGHQGRVAELAAALGTAMGLPSDRVQSLRMAALVHDLGKIEIPSEILCRPGPLNTDEYALVQLHPEKGREILSHIHQPWPLGDVVFQHHERLDGTGYPQGLRGDQILPEARILAVADVVEAMNAHRPYRPALGMASALEELRCHRGTRYDPAVVDACTAVIREGTLPWVAQALAMPPPRTAFAPEDEDLSRFPEH